MRASNQTTAQINDVLNKIIEQYPAQTEQSMCTDITFQVDSDNGMMTVVDDNGEEICSTTIDEWIDYQEDNFFEVVRDVLRTSILSRRQQLESLSLMKPYTFVLTVKDDDEIAQLFSAREEEDAVHEGKLMKGLDKDLDDFMKNLLSD